MTTLLIHGAGSTGAAAAELLGLAPGTVMVEDRTGEVDSVVAALTASLARHPDCTHVVGVSLGAHAVARWAAQTPAPLPRITCVLPAWTGAPSAAAQATARAGDDIARKGTRTILQLLERESPHTDVVRLLQLAWPSYTDEQLARSLTRASLGHGPSPDELAAIAGPVHVVGWRGDAFHPDVTAREWACHLNRPLLALAARPEIRLLRQALETAPAWR